MAQIATVFAKSGRCSEALQLLPLIEKTPGIDEVRRETAMALAQAGNMADAASTAETIGNHYIRSKAWRQIGASQSKADRKGASQSLYKALLAAQKLPAAGGTDVIALQEVAQTQAEMGDLDPARATFRLALEAIHRYEDEHYQSQLVFDVAHAFAKSLDSIEIREWALMQSSPLVAACSLIGAVEGRLDSK